MITELRELSDHMYWADSKIWQEVFKLSDSDKIQPLFDALLHLHLVQHAYLSIWNDQPLDYLAGIKFNSLTELSNWGTEFHGLNMAFMNILNDEMLQRIVNIPWSDALVKILGKPPAESKLVQTIYQVIMHSTYHRGQINTKIRELGGEPPMTDYIYWIWTNKPGAIIEF